MLLEKSNARQTIVAVLDWYLSNIKSEGVPKAYAARSFRRYFNRYLTLMERDRTQCTPISDTAREIVELTGDLLWPNDEKESELQFIQLSIDNFAHFRRYCKTHGTAAYNQLTRKIPIPGHPSRYRRVVASSSLHYPLLLMLLDEYLADVENFITGWTLDVHDMAWGWEDWDGNLLKHAWKVSSSRFKRMMTDRESDVREIEDWEVHWVKMVKDIHEDRKKEWLGPEKDLDRDDHG